MIIDRVNEIQAGIHICAIASLASYVKIGLLVAALASVVASIPCTIRCMELPLFHKRVGLRRSKIRRLRFKILGLQIRTHLLQYHHRTSRG